MRVHKALRYLLFFSLVAVAAGCVHEIGHAVAGLLVGVLTIPTLAKEYVLLPQLDWSKEIWIALGGPIGTFVAALAFKWIRIVFRCWKDRVAYDENKYLSALTKRGSPLGKLVVVDMVSL